MPKGAGSSDGGVASADQVMDIDQFAEFMKISPRTVWRKLSTGELPPADHDRPPQAVVAPGGGGVDCGPRRQGDEGGLLMSTPSFDLSKVPQVLKSLPRWLCWRYEMRDGKQTKVPYRASTGKRADTTNPDDWAAMEGVVAAACEVANNYSGIGFVFAPEDGLSGVDLDDSIGPDGLLEPWAQVIVDGLASYTEVSPSGKGVKIFLKATLEGKERRRTGNIEMYCSGRFFTVTGSHLAGTPLTIEARQAELDALYARTFAPSPAKPASPAPPQTGEDLTDEQIIDLAGKAQNGAKFKKLWGGDTTGYRHDENDGHSEADLALCSILAFYTGADPDRIDRLFRQSGLYREKWLLRQDYREATIEKALAGKTEFYKPGKHDADGGDTDDPSTLADRIVQLAIERCQELFHTPDGEPTAYATITCKGHAETWAVNSRRFKLWLQQLLYEERKKSANDTALTTAIRTLEARANFAGEARQVHLRVGHVTSPSGMTIYLDLGDPMWRVVEITALGWRVLDDSPVKFRRTKSMKALPVPVRGGSIQRLRRFVNAADDYTWHLLVGFAISTLHPTGGYPILVVNGEAGAAKSTTAKVLRKLSDPSGLALRKQSKSDQDLCVAAGSNWVLAFDNLSFISNDFSDTLCTISTGGGMGARALYTNDDEHYINFTRPVILTGIGELVVRDDLLSRSIRVYLERIAKDAKRTERQFWDEFDREHPLILGAMLDGVASALANMGRVEAESKELERMADFCIWATAAEPGLGLKGGSIMAAYKEMLDDAAEITLEASPIAPYLMDLVTPDGWSGTASELLAQLKRQAGVDGDSIPRGWPKAANQLMGFVVRLAVPLRARGFEVWQERSTARKRTRMIHIVPQTASRSSASSAAPMAHENDITKAPSAPSTIVHHSSSPDPSGHSVTPGGTVADDLDDADDVSPSSPSMDATPPTNPDAPDGADDVDGPRRPPFGHPEDYDDDPDALPL